MTAVIVTSDWHLASILTEWPASVLLPNGSRWVNNKVQKWIGERRKIFWEKARTLADGHETICVVNGDICENVDIMHHFPAELVTLNRAYHRRAAVEVVNLLRKEKDRWMIVRGTPVHDGSEGQDAETIAQEIGCPQNKNGTYSYDSIRIKINKLNLFFAHKISGTSSPMSEVTALTGNLVKAAKASGIWGSVMPDIMGFAHRHTASAVHIPGRGDGFDIFTTPAWVARGEYVNGIDAITPVQIGGTVILINEDGTRALHHINWSLPEREYENIKCQS
jgi:hypothetical protein